MNDFKTIHRPDVNRFEIHEDGAVAYAEYHVHDGVIDVMHTIVPMHLENRGIGSALVKAAYDWGRAQGLCPKGTCRFAGAWLARHPEYS